MSSSTQANLDSARAVADAVLYEGYLLYPYRASSAKNRSRWQFGVLGPVGAAAAGVGEEPGLAVEFLVAHRLGASVTVWLRFLQLQVRTVESPAGAEVPQLQVDERVVLPWDEAVEHELEVGTAPLGDTETSFPVSVPGGCDTTEVCRDDGTAVGRVLRTRWPLTASVTVHSSTLGLPPGVARVRLSVDNLGELTSPDAPAATRQSFLGAHLLLTCAGGAFVSALDPPERLREAAQECRHHRCWPLLAGPAGTADVLLASPIILDEHPQIAPESAGSLFDATEIDEILTLRILTMTDAEKAEARATDPRAAEIIDRSESLTPQALARMHGTLRDPSGPGTGGEVGLDGPPTWTTPAGESDVPWWDPERDAEVDPATDVVLIDGHAVARDSMVRIEPTRRADAQDLFFRGQLARVTGVHHDVDGGTHLGVILVDDPAAEEHEWYGRYLYFAPDELVPVETQDIETARHDPAGAGTQPKES